MSKLTKALTAAAGNAGGANLYAEDVFSTYLYTGNGTSQTINNGIDLDGEGGMVWIKNRGAATTDHRLFDTNRGIYKSVSSNLTDAEDTSTSSLTAFNSSGFSLSGFNAEINDTGNTYASWTFRKAEKFFDVVTYTGDGNTSQTINHNLGANVGMIVVKRLDAVGHFTVWHKDISSNSNVLFLSSSLGEISSPNDFQSTAPTSTQFTVGGGLNYSGESFVAYLFASDAGGFGDDGSESIIKCGSYTGDGTSDHSIEVGFEPQWLLIKNTSLARDWVLSDSMRGLNLSQDYILRPNATTIEQNWAVAEVTSTGFRLTDGDDKWNTSGHNFIYIAIRRPMKTPESGTEVFAVDNGNGTSGFNSGFPVDMGWRFSNITTAAGFQFAARLNAKKNLFPHNTDAESNAGGFTFDSNTGWGTSIGINSTDYSWMFKRATGFFDVVAYTGTGTITSYSHNLDVVPELIIIKGRSFNVNWLTWHTDFPNNYMLLNSTVANQPSGRTIFNSEDSSSFTLGSNYSANGSGQKFVAYLFATLAGVSKVGSYTGSNNVGPQTIDCGFSTGARFVLIKNTGIGEWFVFDVERGITVGSTDGVLQLQSTSQEYTEAAWGGGDMIQPHPSGFTLTTNGQLNSYTSTYIFLAIA